MLEVARAAVALGVAVFLAGRVLPAMEAPGWIYWRKTDGLSSIGVGLIQGGAPQDPGRQVRGLTARKQ
ncbi:hypothetical protein GCM10011578_099270 [Streptomyces fuscichromogenes]|uniref:Uncharacterized protein n=1 Tax=Streptomyces fuscichromogenes TaxID=1324013 RepID=A0A918CXM6_9ACTN|nr:hypothetical protein GCM10011578_099270 [Streptomyces fuscichromogenes]